MARIAKAAGVSAGLLHYHFDTKEQLFAEALAYSHGISSRLNEQVLQRTGPEPAQRLSSFLDRCLPSDDLLAHEWLLWQELALLCIRQPHLAEVGASSTRTSTRRSRASSPKGPRPACSTRPSSPGASRRERSGALRRGSGHGCWRMTRA